MAPRILLLTLLACLGLNASLRATGPLTLRYAKPAADWMTEALPVGNGSLGAMVFGGTQWERLQFNEQSLWLGDENDTGSYQPFGDVLLRLGHEPVSGYSRTLDLENATQTVRYECNGVHYERTVFASHPAGVLIVRLKADQPGQCSADLFLTDEHEAAIAVKDSEITSKGRLPNGLQYQATLLVLHEGGTESALGLSDIDLADAPKKVANPGLRLAGCDSITLVLAAGTDFAQDSKRKWRGPHPAAAIAERVQAAARKGYDAVLAEHIADYRSLFTRVAFDIGKTDTKAAELPTNERLARLASGGADPELEALYFQYGRYLLISSSRAGGLPANLQGLWNDSLTPPWRCDYHSNINVQMNYWPAEPANLSECHVPFFDYVTSIRDVRRAQTLAEIPGVRGWTVKTENNLMGAGSFVWNYPASAWYSRHYWEHYAFTGDKTFLRAKAYPVLREVCEFWEDRLKSLPDGTLVCPDGWSPEHGPREDGVAMDQQIVWDLFNNFVKAAETLGVEEDYRAVIAAKRDRLAGPQIGRWGQLQEWRVDRDDPDDQHRHVSHLFAVYPGNQISLKRTPELATAARISLLARGDGGTGWSMAWKINFYARLLDGDHAHRLLLNQMRIVGGKTVNYGEGGGTYPNFFDAHPPFQIDGNFGATSGICEMLLQSQDDELALLPALPSSWPNGSVSGLRARGGFTVDLTWSKGKLVEAVIHSLNGTAGKATYGKRKAKLSLKAGETLRLDGRLKVLP